jgi:hypothetical protein
MIKGKKFLAAYSLVSRIAKVSHGLVEIYSETCALVVLFPELKFNSPRLFVGPSWLLDKDSKA